jgi:hypothetical protein
MNLSWWRKAVIVRKTAANGGGIVFDSRRDWKESR